LELAKGYAPYAHFAPMKVLIMTIQQEVRIEREGGREGGGEGGIICIYVLA